MQYRTLGQTGLNVSVIGLGCWAFAGDSIWGAQDEAASIATVHAALDAGVNLFDTAEGYGAGRSEEVLGKALIGRRQRAIIATKVSANHLTVAETEQACNQSLRALQTDYIDLYQIHWPSRQIAPDETWKGLELLQQKGKVRFIGVCNFGVQDLADMLRLGQVESNQLPYNLLWRAIEYAIQPECVARRVTIVPYFPLMQGLLTGKFATADDVPPSRARTRHFSKARPGTRHGEEGYEAETFAAIDRLRDICRQANLSMAQASLAWLLGRPGVTCVLAGARRSEQVMENVAAAELQLSADVAQELSQATEELKQKLGPNPDAYEGGSNTRFR